jgi:hypothetical protein
VVTRPTRRVDGVVDPARGAVVADDGSVDSERLQPAGGQEGVATE